MDEGQECVCVCVCAGQGMLLRIILEAQADPCAHTQINGASVSQINTHSVSMAFRS